MDNAWYLINTHSLKFLTAALWYIDIVSILQMRRLRLRKVESLTYRCLPGNPHSSHCVHWCSTYFSNPTLRAIVPYLKDFFFLEINFCLNYCGKNITLFGKSELLCLDLFTVEAAVSAWIGLLEAVSVGIKNRAKTSSAYLHAMQ